MPTIERTSRRAVLATLAAGATAGCLGDSGADVTPEASLPPPVQGDPEADVTVMAFEDYACPHCQTYSLEVLPELEARYVEPGEIRYEHRDFPIPVDSTWSWAAAGAARAVQDTVGDEAFFTYAHRLFEHLGDYSMELVGSLAEEVGADPGTVKEAASDGTYRPLLEAEKEAGREMGLEGTPQVYVNGEKTSGYDLDTVSAAIEDAL